MNIYGESISASRATITVAALIRTVPGPRTLRPYDIVEEQVWQWSSVDRREALPRWQHGDQPPADWRPTTTDPDAKLISARIRVHATDADGYLVFPSRAADSTEEEALVAISNADEVDHIRQILRDVRGPVTREVYERLCRGIGAEPFSDAAIRRWDVGFGSLANPPRILAEERRQAMRREAPVVDTALAPAPAIVRWGARGVRYDEQCERCRRVSEVDNSSGLCAACGGA